MTVKELKNLYDKLDSRLLALQNAILNHSGIHRWDRIIQAMSLIAMIIVIFLLKEKIL